ncbi:DUF4359 domain-containing protein [Synechococcus bigranulatus str. 'Rupite']|uniref:DUF4359 domain-containing protein n=2 Tax=Thermostichus vulcanus TaxID=32053 RepID=A0ABT0C6T9_THEVL|nr:DUF4359 domain-containing protein [Thermostichus vulcanus str. 'Rupite']
MLNRLSLLSGFILAAGITTLVLTNPTLEEYGAYAGEQLAAYVTQEYCAQIPAFLNSLIGECQALVQELQPELKALFIRQTRRQNFGIFSLYTTDLSLLNLGPLGGSLPTYRFATLAGAGRFYTYEIVEIRETP